MDTVEALFAHFQAHGEDAYFGEAVTQTAHGLQAAWLAQQAGASDALIAAALLHDIGHLLPGQSEDLADSGVDGIHEEAGEAYLMRWFTPEVTEPVRLHVAAKRYLCATEPGYFDALSPASRKSLELQGGPMSPAEVKDFEMSPHYSGAVRLRRWDDEAKVPDLAVPELETYRPLLESLLRPATPTEV